MDTEVGGSQACDLRGRVWKTQTSGEPDDAPRAAKRRGIDHSSSKENPNTKEWQGKTTSGGEF